MDKLTKKAASLGITREDKNINYSTENEVGRSDADRK